MLPYTSKQLKLWTMIPNLTTRECLLAETEWPLSTDEEGLAEIAQVLGAMGKTSMGLASRYESIRRQILAGQDPLGERLISLRSPATRRPWGATYTPFEIIDEMVRWAEHQGSPVRVIDPGTGSGRFLLRAARAFPEAELVGVELDPLAALIARTNLAVIGAGHRSRVIVADYRGFQAPPAAGQTLYLGNPPYVRHHGIAKIWKQWLSRTAAGHGLKASQLAGLHVHFFLATVAVAAPEDYGVFITAAEWLDVNYGQLVRDLFLERLGGLSIAVIEPTASCFTDAATTSAITTFRVGARSKQVGFTRAQSHHKLDLLCPEILLPREKLLTERRWSHLARSAKQLPADFIDLGELFRVHRGQVTGANQFWIAGEHSSTLPLSVLVPTVTKAKELIEAGLSLRTSSQLRKVIDLPRDLDQFSANERQAVERFLRLAKQAGADRSYIARNRTAWWSVGLREPAPILATYMARRSPAFVRNLAEARHLNIAHGLYPRQTFSNCALDKVVHYLASGEWADIGRTYAGGLVKFEPKEMERIPISTSLAFEALH